MYRRNRNRPMKIPLVVKEVTLPKKQADETSQSYFQNDFYLLRAEVDRFVENTTTVKLGSHEVKSVHNLLILEKKPLENYFEGTIWKKKVRKKVKPQKENLLSKFNVSSQAGVEGQPGGSKKTIDKVIQECFTREEKIQRKKLLINLHHYETLKEHRERKNHLQQRLEQKKYIQQQENLYDTWLGLLKRRNQLKDLSVGDNNYPKHDCQKSRCSYNPGSISILSQEYRNDNKYKETRGLANTDKKPQDKIKKEEEEPEREKTEPVRRQIGLCEGILEKLVLVDDDESND